ncbi:MAG: flavodoxin family protein [Anaerolineae bacterium]
MASILILYHSQQYGNTQQMAMAVAEGAKAAGASVTIHNTNEGRFDVEAYRKFDAVAFGSPDYYSYIAGTLKVFLDDWFIAKGKDPADLEDKPIALFYSHGGGGAVKRPLENLFSRLGYQVGETVESLRAPSERVITALRDLGRQLAEAAADA